MEKWRVCCHELCSTAAGCTLHGTCAAGFLIMAVQGCWQGYHLEAGALPLSSLLLFSFFLGIKHFPTKYKVRIWCRTSSCQVSFNSSWGKKPSVKVMTCQDVHVHQFACFSGHGLHSGMLCQFLLLGIAFRHCLTNFCTLVLSVSFLRAYRVQVPALFSNGSQKLSFCPLYRHQQQMLPNVQR